jgi:aspartyl-tRNA(Asn)/glutamyl-tRNA(Gln) amidotransferase subunit A
MKPHMYTLKEIGGGFREGSLTPSGLAKSLLDRIEKIEPIIRAWVTVDKNAVIEQARVKDEEVKDGLQSGIHGVPIGVKDIYCTRGIKTTMGSPIFKDYIPADDADMVIRVHEVGGITLGKTETTEFALHDPAPTRNPWNTRHTPGGSSSGSAAAVASGMCPVAFGSQTGGSVIRPASYCGIVGMKPTYDLLSRGNVFPLSWSLDHIGYMTRTVEDAYIMLKALTGEKRGHNVKEKPPRIGVLSGYFKTNADENVWAGFENAMAKLWGEGVEAIDVQLPESFELAPDVHRVVMSVETAAAHEDMFKTRRDEYREYMQGFISSGLLVPATSYLRAQRLRGEIIKDLVGLIRQYDCVVCPSSVDTAPEGLEWTGSPAFNAPWSLTGLPSVTVPSGLAENKMPLGLQLIGTPYSEWELLEVAGWCERVLGSDSRPIDPVT